MTSVRIGNGCGFWGDNVDAPILLAEHGRLDYLTLEYLAELTMSILALQKQKDASRGYAHDFLDVLARLVLVLKDQPQLKIVTNAGGMNPHACGDKAKAILATAGLQRRVAIVTGDDLMPSLDALVAQDHALAHMDSGQPLSSIRERVVSANAYLGAAPIVEALQSSAEIVITGRIADASLTVGPAMHAFGWRFDQLDQLCGATVAGHLIECGAQATGGLWCNVKEDDDLADVGYPIADIVRDGSFTLGKPPNTGGAVNVETATEQLLYEVGDPAAYLTPDVTADFTSVRLEQAAPDLVRVTGAKGKPATDSYKVSIAFRDGYYSSGTLLIYGGNATSKARQCGEMVRRRLARADATPNQFHVECLGAGDTVPGASICDPPEVVLRVTVRDSRKAVVERFTRELAPLVTSGPPGVTGYTSGRPPVREVFAYWPALIAKDAVKPRAEVI